MLGGSNFLSINKATPLPNAFFYCGLAIVSATALFFENMDNKVLEVPCEFTPRRLGCLYDDASGSFLDDSLTVWDRESIDAAAKASSSFQSSSNVEIMSDDGDSKRNNLYGIDVSLTLGFFAGMVKVKGSVGFLVERNRSRKVVRLTLKYQCSTKFEQLSTTELTGSVNSRIKATTHQATHVVVGVLYGASAYFVFEREIKQDEDYNKVKGSLELSIGVLVAKVSVGAELEVELRSKIDTTAIKCTYHTEGFNSDASAASLNFEDALKKFKELPSFIDDKSVVPQRVWLIPLSFVPGIISDTKVLQRVSSHYSDSALKIMDDLVQAVSQVDDLANDVICSKFEFYKTKFIKAKEKILQFREKCAFDFVTALADVRRGRANEDGLAEIIKGYYSSPFSNSRLQLWFDTKERELRFLKRCIKFLEDGGVQFSGEGGEFVFANVFYLGFYFYEEADFFDELQEHMEHDTSDNFVQEADSTQQHDLSSNPATSRQWIDNPDLLTDMRRKVLEFKTFAKRNRNCDCGKFFYKQLDEPCPEKDVLVVISMEASSSLIVCPFVPPSPPPGKPMATIINHNTVSVAWCKSERGLEHIQGYWLYYRLENEDNECWEFCGNICDPETTDMKIDSLLSNACYVFRVSAVCKSWNSIGNNSQCISEYSEISDPVVTERSAIADNYKTLPEKSTINGIRVIDLPTKSTLEDVSNKVMMHEIGNPINQEDDVKTLILVHLPEIDAISVAEVIANHILGVSWQDDHRFALPCVSGKKDWMLSYLFHWQEGMAIPYSLNIVIAPDMSLPMGGMSSAQLNHFDSINLIAFLTAPGLFVDLSLENACQIQSLFSVVIRSELENRIVNLKSLVDETLDAIPTLDVPFTRQFNVSNDGLFKTGADTKTFWLSSTKGCMDLLKFLCESDSVSLKKTTLCTEKQKLLLQTLEDVSTEKKEIDTMNDQICQLESKSTFDDATELKNATRKWEKKHKQIISKCSKVSQEIAELSLLTISPSILSNPDDLDALVKENTGNNTVNTMIRNKAFLLEYSIF